ncbi:MAG: hypothetical protein ABW223_11725, partial [Rariglobus sp.]
MNFVLKSGFWICSLLFLAGCSREQEPPHAQGAYVDIPLSKSGVSQSGRYLLTFAKTPEAPTRGHLSITSREPSTHKTWSAPSEYDATTTWTMWDENDNVWVYQKKLGLSVWRKDIATFTWTE